MAQRHEFSSSLLLCGSYWPKTGTLGTDPIVCTRGPEFGATPLLPIVGNLFQLDRKAPYKSVLKSYGPVVKLDMGPQRVVFLVGYNTVKEALVDQADDFIGRGPLPFIYFTLTTLRDFGMGRKGMEQWIQEESSHLVERIKTINGEPFDPTYFLSCSVSNIICCLVFGQRFSYDDQHFLHLLQIISHTLISISSPWAVLYNIFPRLMEWLPGGHHKAFARIEELRQFVIEKDQEHEDTLDMNSPRDYIDCFLTRGKDMPTEFHYENLISTVFNLFLGGTETTSSTIRFALNVLIKYPEIQEKMQKEIDSIIGQERCPFMEDRKSLHFVDAVLQEAFYGYCASGSPGTMIFPMLHSVLKEETQWTTPLSFNPQHFLDETMETSRKIQHFFPFPQERGLVLGNLARMEMFLFLVTLLQRFTFTCPGGPDSIDLSPEFSSFANVHRRYNIIATLQ
uniref:Cytochrome P450 n=1 Tax=Neogobius melanostomus TaxID=47308 RepID=A0A8C6T5D9_9GOBI